MQIIDLSHVLKNQMPVYPETRVPQFLLDNTIEKDGFAEIFIQMSSHTGTHIDAPAHILKNSKSLSEYKLTKFVGPAIKIPCMQFAGNEIALEYLMDYCNDISNVEFVIFETGWDKFWDTPQYYTNFPVLSHEAASWLAKFNLKGIGADTISVDLVGSLKLPNHHIFLQNEILIVENLCRLNDIVLPKFTFQCFPLPLENADGSSLRAAAFCEEEIQSFFI